MSDFETTRRGLLTSAAAGLASAGAFAAAAGAREGVTAGDLADAAKTLGVDFTAAEREQMLAGFEGQLDVIRALRAMEKPNTLAPAQVFDPRLPGVAYPEPENNAVDLVGDAGAKPSADVDIAYAPVWRLARWLKTRRITSRRLTEIYLERIERHAGTLECFVTVMPERALAEADAADAELQRGFWRGPLHGVPYGLKDLFDAEGAPTTWGATPYKDAPPAERDCAVARRLKFAGAVLLGKTTTGALAYGDRWFAGMTRNPFNPEEGSSGSSAGSASATAAGLIGFGIGTETLGSIVSPSHRCGTAGLRPTFGRVSRAGVMALCWSLDKVGALARSAVDLAFVLDALNGHDDADPSSLAHGFSDDGSSDVSGMTIGVDPHAYEEADPLDVAAREAARDAGATITEITLPEVPGAQLVLALVVEAAAAFEELTLTNRDDELAWQDDGAWPNTFRQARFISAIDYVQIDRIRRKLMGDLHAAFAGVDAVMGPNYAAGMLRATNFTGHPQVAFRAGFQDHRTRTIFEAEPEEGATHAVPYASSVWGPLFGEAAALRVARAVEARLGVAETRPDFA